MYLYKNEEIRQSMDSYKLNMDVYEDCQEYARMLKDDKVSPVPACLRGIQESRNGMCEWYREKAFINYYLRKINFEAVSRLFEPVPVGQRRVIYKDFDVEYSSDAVQDDGIVDTRNKVVAQLDENHFVVIEIDPSDVPSGKFHIVTAWFASPQEVREAEEKRRKYGTTDLFESLVRRDSYDHFGAVPEYIGDVNRFYGIYSQWKSGSYNVLELANKLYSSGFGLSIEQADKIAYDWLNKKNVEYLVNLMDKAF